MVYIPDQLCQVLLGIFLPELIQFLYDYLDPLWIPLA
jgi:hypothetical protein